VFDSRSAGRRRARWLLLVPLWISAGCAFLVLDLLPDVAELDRTRPRSLLYREIPVASHEVVGEPIDVRSGRSPPGHGALGFVSGNPRTKAEFRHAAAIGDEPALRRLALTAEDPVCAGNAVRALGRLRAVAGDPDLVGLLDDPRPNVRDQLILALGSSGRPEAIELLEPLLRASDRKVRILATQAVGDIGGPRADTLLAEIFADREAKRDRETAPEER
jgi:hypothetical protein